MANIPNADTMLKRLPAGLALNCSSYSGSAPMVGDFLYSDLSYGSIVNYGSDKTPVGVIWNVSGSNVSVVSIDNFNNHYKWDASSSPALIGVRLTD